MRCKHLIHSRSFLLIAITIFVSSSITLAAEVAIGVSSQESYVGVPIELQVQVRNASTHRPPVIEDVDGLTIQLRGRPSQSTQLSIVNGRRSERSTLTYSYDVTPVREGEFTIPPIKVSADGIATVTKAVKIVATKSETGDLMFVEIIGKKERVYVGQSLDLTLKIWIRPYRNRDYKVTLDARNMWNLVSRNTNWGPFEEAINTMREQREVPRGRSVLREDASGEQSEYYLYEIDATTYPDRPGQIDGNGIRVIVEYPVSLGRSRSPLSMFDDDFFGGSMFGGSMFGSRISITEVRPISAAATVGATTVLPIPTEGRPDDYRGAVGKYSILSQVTTDRVRVGDPITLRIGIDGEGPMELVSAPPLESQANLIDNFKVPDESLAGFIDGKRKVFTTTIRPRRADVTEVPPITMSYFDPDKEEFVRIQSRPILIDVEEAEVLALDSIVGAKAGNLPSSADEGIRNAGVGDTDQPASDPYAILRDAEILNSHPRAELISKPMWFFLCLPPLLAFALGVFRVRHLAGGLTSAKRQLKRRLAAATTPDQISDALAYYLARKFRLPNPSEAHFQKQLRDQTVGRLRANHYHDVAIKAERLYCQCDAATQANVADLESLKEQAWDVADAASANSKSQQTVFVKRLASSPLWLAMVSSLVAGPSVLAGTDLSRDQQQAIHEEAVFLYAFIDAESDPNKAASLAEDAAAKFQLLVESGIQNDKLYCNLANAQFRAGNKAKAIANYRRALRLDPTEQIYFERLRAAQESSGNDNQNTIRIREFNDLLLQYVSAKTMQAIAVVSWIAFWLLVAIRLFKASVPWKAAAACLLLVAFVSGGSYFLRVGEFVADTSGVLIGDSISVRTGDGESFPERTALSSADGTIVQVLDQRQDWIQIELKSGVQGWVNASGIEVI